MPPDCEPIEPVEQSYFAWIMEGLGPVLPALLAVATLLSLALVLIIMRRGRGPMAGVALLFVVPLPFITALAWTLHCGVLWYMVLASNVIYPKPYYTYTALSHALLGPLVGILLSLPGYVLAVAFSMVRALRKERAEEGVAYSESRLPKGT